VLANALAQEAQASACNCSQCGGRVAESDFVRYVFDFTFEKDQALRPDSDAVNEHGVGECRRCWDDAPDSTWRGKCVRCGRSWGHLSHCPNCRGRVQ
jgi:hypothetical protein